MLYLLEVSYANDKESVAIYPNDNHPEYANETELWAEFEDKLGTAQGSDAVKAELLIGFDSTGRILERQSRNGKIKALAHHVKMVEVTETIDGVEIVKTVPAATLSPRLITVKNQNDTENINLSKKDTANQLEGAAHKSMGVAMSDETVKAMLAMGVVDGYIICNDYWTRPVEPQPTSQPEQTPEEPTE